MALSEKVTTDLVAWTNADILLAGDVTTAINYLHTQHPQQHQQPDVVPPNASSSSFLWMAVAARLDLLPTATQGNGRVLIENEIRQNSLATFLHREGVLHTQGRIDNNGLVLH